MVRLSPKLQIQTPDGVNHQAKLIPNANQKNLDLALLQITTNNNYTVAKLASELPTEGTQILSSGFPVETGKLKLITGEIGKIPANAFKEGYQIGFKGDMDIGMSGGAILNENGEIIGINGRKAYPVLNTGFVYEDETKPNDTEIQTYRTLNWGIPLATFFAQLNPEIITAYSLLPVTPNGTDTNTNTKNSLLETVFKPIKYTGKVAELEEKAKQFSVKIEGFGEENKFIENGSGVIIAKEGDTYYVLTAFHVVKNYIERETINTIKEFKKGNIEYKYKITAPDGKVYEVDNTKIKAEEGVDLAVVQFKSTENYGIATLANYRVGTGDYTLAAGFPYFSENNSPWRFTFGYIFPKEVGLLGVRNKNYQLQSSPNLTPSSELSPSTVNFAPSLPIGTLEGGYELVYTSMTLEGMSGGAVLDIEGRVIGIHGLGEGNREKGNENDKLIGNSLGIPISTFLGMTNRLGVKPQQVSTEKPKPLSENDLQILAETILEFDFGSDKTNAEGWMYRGNQLWRLGRNEEAIKAFDEAIKQKPDFIHLAYYGKGLALGDSSYNSGKDQEAITATLQEAITALQQATQAKPGFVAAWSQQSTVYRYLKEWELALSAIDKAISLDGENPNLYNEKYGVLSELERYPEALTVITTAIKLAPRAAFYYNRGKVYYELKEYQKAIADYTEAIKIDNNLALAYNNRGIVYTMLNEYKKAMADFTQAIDIDDNLAQAYYLRGIVYTMLNEYEKAIADYTQAINIDNKYAYAYYLRGLVYAELKEYEKAIADYTQAIDIDDKFVYAYYVRGRVYSDLKEYQKAIADYTQAINIDNKYVYAYFNRGIVYTTLNEYKKAIFDFTQAINIDKNYADAYYGRGIVYLMLEEYQKAISDYTQAINIDQNYAKAYYGRGNVYNDLKEYQKAIDDYTQAIDIDDKFVDAYYLRGRVYSDLKEYKKAIADYTQAINIDNKYAYAYFNRGIVYTTLNEYKKAIFDFTQAINIDKNYADAYYGRGIAYSFQEEFQKALVDAEKAAELYRQQGNKARYQQVQEIIDWIKQEMSKYWTLDKKNMISVITTITKKKKQVPLSSAV